MRAVRDLKLRPTCIYPYHGTTSPGGYHGYRGYRGYHEYREYQEYQIFREYHWSTREYQRVLTFQKWAIFLRSLRSREYQRVPMEYQRVPHATKYGN